MKKNVAIIVQHLYGGGAERSAGLLAKKLDEKYNVYLFLWDCSNIVYDYAGEIIDCAVEGIDYIEYYIRAYKEKYNIVCAISFLEPANFMNIKTKGKECVIISERCAQSPIRSQLNYYDANIRMLYNYADRIISVSHGVKDDLIKNYGVHERLIRTIYNFIDKDTIERKSKEKLHQNILDFIGSSKVILNVGRMVKQKNQKKLIVQFAKLINDGEDVKLIIIGDGELEDELIKTSRELGVSEFVKIIKYNKNPFPFYKLATIVAVSSEYEGLPNVILEAMLLGVPVVSTDCLAGPRELLRHSENYENKICGYKACKNGILVEQAESDEVGVTTYFKDAMKYLLDNEEIRNSIIHNELEYMETYNNQSILEEWINVIENTVHSEEKIPVLINSELIQKVLVYGAGFVGKQVMKQLMQQYLENNYKPELLAFVVSRKEENEENIFGIPVYGIEDVLKYRYDAVILIGVGGKYVDEVISTLEHWGFNNIKFPIIKGMRPDEKKI